MPESWFLLQPLLSFRCFQPKTFNGGDLIMNKRLRNNLLTFAVLLLLLSLVAACNVQFAGPPLEDSTSEPTQAEETPMAAATEVMATVEPETEEPENVQGEIVTLFVGPETVDCVGVGPQTCLLVKENPDDEYMYFYDTIGGFQYEPGYEYELLVLVEPVENPPADASSLKYTLVAEVGKTPVAIEPAPETETMPEQGAENTPDAAITLEGMLWTLESYANSAGETVEVLPETSITAEFVDGKVGGSAGCNRYFGAYMVDGDNLSVQMGGVTMMLCPEEAVNQQEQDYLTVLESSTSYQITDNQLQIANADGDVVLTYVVDEGTPLTGTIWQLISFNTGNALLSNLTTELITAAFGEDGQLTGFGGCNNYMAGYEIDGDTMAIGPVAATRKMCADPEEVMDTEVGYLAALQQVASYDISGDELTLLNAEGAHMAVYRVSAPAASELVGPVWQWLSFQGGDDSTIEVDAPNHYTVEFQPDGNLNIRADCNIVGGTYAVDGSSLSLETTTSTMAACPPDSLADDFLKNLSAAASYIIEEGQLYISLMTDAGIMQFEQ